MHIEDTSDLAHRLTVTVAALDGLAPLVRCQLRLAAEPHPTGLGPFPPLGCTRADQLALELGQAAQDWST